MSAEFFLDTNVLVYAAVDGSDAPKKKQQALSLIDAVDFGISAQVLQEFYVTVTRKAAVPMAAEDALAWIEALEVFPCVSIDSALVKLAAENSLRYQISYWDGAIIAAAHRLGATRIFSEDLNHGQDYGGAVVLNPFTA